MAALQGGDCLGEEIVGKDIVDGERLVNLVGLEAVVLAVRVGLVVPNGHAL